MSVMSVSRMDKCQEITINVEPVSRSITVEVVEAAPIDINVVNTGPRGIQGLQGPQGERGPAGDISNNDHDPGDLTLWFKNALQ